MGQSDQLANCMERDQWILGASLDRQIAAGAALDQLVAFKGWKVNEGWRPLRREPVPVFPVLQEQSGPKPEGQSQPGGRPWASPLSGKTVAASRSVGGASSPRVILAAAIVQARSSRITSSRFSVSRSSAAR